jgi:hypothetical protein
MHLIDMSQYEGEDREQVVAGERILLALCQTMPDMVMHAWRYVSFTSAETALRYLMLPVGYQAPHMSREDAEASVAYLRACDRVWRVIRRLQ